jgi:hypothetical protein
MLHTRDIASYHQRQENKEALPNPLNTRTPTATQSLAYTNSNSNPNFYQLVHLLNTQHCRDVVSYHQRQESKEAAKALGAMFMSGVKGSGGNTKATAFLAKKMGTD